MTRLIRATTGRLSAALTLLACALPVCLAPGAAQGQIIDSQIPLNYNFHGMARADEVVTVNTNSNADLIQYRSISDRGLYFDPASPHAIGSTPLVGSTGITYGLFNTLSTGTLDIVHLGNRAVFRPYEAVLNPATARGGFPIWAPDAASNNHTTPQVTTLPTPVTLDATAEIGVLYHASDSGGQFDVVLTFSDASTVTATLRAPDWFGAQSDPAVVAGAGGFPVLQQRRVPHTVNGVTYLTFQGVENEDAATVRNFLTTNAGPNLNVIEGVLSAVKMAANGINVAGRSLVSITFQNATYPANTGRGYSIFAATVRTGQPLNANCATPQAVVAGDTAGSNGRTFGAAPSGCGTNDSTAVYYAYTATGDNTIEARTCGSTLDTTLAVYAACGAAPIVCNDNGCGVGSRVQWQGVANTTYIIRVAGNNAATGSFTLHIDDPAHVDITMPLQFNWNGICNGTAGAISEQTLPATGAGVGAQNENRSNLNGYRSIADRGLLCDGVSLDALNFGGTVGFQGILYQVYATGLQSDMVHLGDRNLAAGGGRAFSPSGTTWPAQGGAATTDNGLSPIWLNNPDQTGPQTSSMASLNAVFGPATQIGVLYHMANGGTSFGSFDVTLAFTDGTSATVTLDATDWFGTNTTAMPAPRAGAVIQRKMGGPWRAVQATDRAVDALTAGRLWVNEGVISTDSLSALGFSALGKTLASITFGNVRSAPNGAGDAITSAFGIYAATLRDPLTFNLNFGPGGVGTVTPNLLVAGSTGRMTVNVSRGSGAPNNITSVVVDGASIGLGPITLNDSGLFGDTNPNDNIWSTSLFFPVNTSSGAASLPFTVTDAQSRTATGNIIFSVTAPSALITPNPVLAGDPATATVTLSPNTGGPNDVASVTLDAGAIGAGVINLNDNGTSGDAVANDGIWSVQFTVPASSPPGLAALGLTITDVQFRSGFGSAALSVIAPPISTDLGALAAGVTTISDTLDPGVVKWLKLTLPVEVSPANNNFLDIDTEGTLLSGTNDTFIGLYSAVGALIGTADDDDGSGFLSQLSYGAAAPARSAVGNGVEYNGRDGTLAAGVYYLAYTEFPATFGATNWTVASTGTQTGTVNVNIAFGTIPAGGLPPVFTDLGTFGTNQVSSTRPLTAGGVQWFRFTLDSTVNTIDRAYLDIDTENSAVANTVIGLFRDDGSVVATDNDSGSALFSQLTFGRGTRPAPGDGNPYDGRNGGSLAAGTYYLALTENAASFGPNFTVFFNTGQTAADVTVTVVRGIEPPPAPTIVVGPVTNPANNHQYYLFDRGLNWLDAEAAAQVLGGHLVTINDADENEWVRVNVLTFDGADRRGWIGLNDAQTINDYQWASGEPFFFSNWSAGEPSQAGGIEFYVEMFANGLWNDLPLAGAAAGDFAIVEIDTPPCRADFNGDTFIDPDDLSDYISCYFDLPPCGRADFNGDSFVDPDDLSDFISIYFAGCP